MLLTAATGVVVVASLYRFLQQRGPVRWLALAGGTPAAVLVLFAAHRLLWVAVTSAGLLAAAIIAARTALRPDRSEWG